MIGWRWSGTVADATRVVDAVLANGGTARYVDDTSPPYIAVDTVGGGVSICYAGDRILLGESGEGFTIG